MNLWKNCYIDLKLDLLHVYMLYAVISSIQVHISDMYIKFWLQTNNNVQSFMKYNMLWLHIIKFTLRLGQKCVCVHLKTNAKMYKPSNLLHIYLNIQLVNLIFEKMACVKHIQTKYIFNLRKTMFQIAIFKIFCIIVT